MHGYSHTDSRPVWAQSMNLPGKDSLQYVQALTLAVIGAFLVTYMISRAVADPSAPFKAARKRLGV